MKSEIKPINKINVTKIWTSMTSQIIISPMLKFMHYSPNGCFFEQPNKMGQGLFLHEQALLWSEWKHDSLFRILIPTGS